MTSWNMPPGTNVTMIPGWEMPEFWWPQCRCPFCHCWVSTRNENWLRSEVHLYDETCYGATPEDDLYIHDQCEIGNKPHAKHTVKAYAGVTNWYRCKRCGASAPVDEY